MESAHIELQKILEKSAPHYGDSECPECRGTGIIHDPMGRGQMGSFSVCHCVENITLCESPYQPPYEYFDNEVNAMKPCPSRPARQAIDRIYSLLKKSEIPPRYQNKLISSIIIDEGEESSMSLLIALDRAVEVIHSFGKGQTGGLYLYGPAGSGKTHMACVVLNELIRLYQVPVQYAKISRDIIGKLRETFSAQSENYGEGGKLERHLGTVPVLLIDDFGIQRESPWVNSVLYDLIDQRYENDRLTLLTSNEPMAAWKDMFRGRLYSRLKEMCMEVEVDAPDFRLKHKQRR